MYDKRDEGPGSPEKMDTSAEITRQITQTMGAAFLGERWVLHQGAQSRWAPPKGLQARRTAGQAESLGQAMMVSHPADLAWTGLSYSVSLYTLVPHLDTYNCMELDTAVCKFLLLNPFEPPTTHHPFPPLSALY